MTKPQKHKLYLLLGMLVIIGAIAVIIIHFTGGPKEERYITATIDRADMQQSVSASGTLNPVKLVNVGTQISGVVQKLYVDYNDRVTEGQVLAELDQSLLKAQLLQSQGALASAQAALKESRANYNRNKALFDKDYVARADLDLARQQLETAQAQVETASGQVEHDKINIGYSVIRSPVAGVIISRSVDVGQTVAASFQTPTLFTIAQDLKKMEIDTNLSEADVGNVKEAMKVRFSVDAFPSRQFEGVVRQVRLNPTTQQNVVTYNVVIDVNNDDLTLLPGMTAFVTLIEAQRTGVLRVPNTALNYRPADAKLAAKNKPADGEHKAKDTKAVYVLRDGQPTRVQIKIGINDNKFTEVLEGDIKEGEPVITEENTPRKSGAKPAMPTGPRLF